MSQDSWTSRPDKAQSQNSPKPKLQPIKGDRMTDSSIIKASRIDTLGRRLDEVERHLGTSAGPNDGPQEQPPQADNEMGAKRQGPSSKDLSLKMMARGGMLPPGSEDDMAEHPAGLESDNDQMRPKSQEYMDGYMAGKFAAGGSVEETPENRARRTKQPISATFASEAPDTMKMTGDDEDESGAHMAAEGGTIDLDEMENEKHSSIAAAIMAKKKDKPGSMSGSPDEEDAERDMYAEGGQVDLSHNADEEPNNEDQMSFQALKKENYSESDGLDELGEQHSNEIGDEREDESENKRDMISAIRSKMKSRKQFSRP